MKPQDETIMFVGEVRQKLFKNQFYSKDKLDTLLDMIKTERGDLSNYISSHEIDYNNKIIQLQFRKIFITKYEEDSCNALAFYNIMNTVMNKFFDTYRSEVYSMMHVSDVIKFYTLPISLFYLISRLKDNTIMIRL